MPAGGVEQRAAELELLAVLEHRRTLGDGIDELLDRATGELGDRSPDSPERADLREWGRERERASRLPEHLVAERARLESHAQSAWSRARAANDFAGFAPWLDRLLANARSRGEALRVDARHADAWEALAEDYEPGLSAQRFSELLDELVPRQRALLAELRGRPVPRLPRMPAATDRQEALVRALSVAIGFDFDRGRLDRSTHPFCSGTHPGDVRITTRFDPEWFPEAVSTVLHESGHGLYEQGLPQEAAGRPWGKAASLGAHEGQSRLWENHVGRSRGFWSFAQPLVVEHLGLEFAAFDAETMWRSQCAVEPSFIRVDADEVTYDLHVALRFRIERDLVAGNLAVSDLPERWNHDFRELFDLEVPDDRRGCLQDVHWAAGLFGYFPTYTLGNLQAAQLYAEAYRELGDLDAAFAAGEFRPLLAWLRRRVHAFGARLSAAELVRHATGRELGTAAFLDSLEARYRAAHDVN